MTKKKLSILIYNFNQNKKVKEPKMYMNRLSYLLFPKLTKKSAEVKLSFIISGKRKKPLNFDMDVLKFLNNE